uniref:NADH-ubiquinone oxidoreductase chain 2 n=1 Tax=Tenebrionoidea sp. 19 KM-2017 TaxID=2219474 RepID=A0A346RIZ4_9CUCU|nr:NADH dehydrogenase subunit 2 [Tenebrionoidea sp. 19 KM-2017]
MIFFNFIILGTLITISSYSWMSMWMGLEINLLSIIPLINSSKNCYSTEASLKYFLTQTLASLILMFAIIMMLLSIEFISPLMNQSMLLVMNSSLLTKLGAAPFHFWMPEVMEGLSWTNCMIMFTWQKIAPMILIMNNKYNSKFLMLITISSILMSSISMMNQISLRKIMTFSSINHIGWMIAAMMTNFSIWSIYFMTYSFLTIMLTMLFKWTKSFYIKQLSNSMNNQKAVKILLMCNFLSLGGLPPFWGFLPKWMIINTLLWNNLIIESLVMIILTLISLFVYIQLSYLTLIMNTEEPKINQYKPQNKIINSLSLISLTAIISVTFILNSF